MKREKKIKVKEREIKFRAWEEDLKIMHPISFTERDRSCQKFDYNAFTNKDLVIMQYIGLEDKYDKDIFEGDIVEIRNIFCQDDKLPKYHRWIGKKAVITYVESKFSLCSEEQDSESDPEIVNIGIASKNSGSDVDFENAIDCDDLEIIGNIYENPELIKN